MSSTCEQGQTMSKKSQKIFKDFHYVYVEKKGGSNWNNINRIARKTKFKTTDAISLDRAIVIINLFFGIIKLHSFSLK